jgi:hypothetical protein
MSEGVIYAFEIIHIKKQDRYDIFFAPSMLYDLFQAVLKKQTIGKTCQGIIICHPVNIVFGALALYSVTN